LTTTFASTHAFRQTRLLTKASTSAAAIRRIAAILRVGEAVSASRDVRMLEAPADASPGAEPAEGGASDGLPLALGEG
jgi:hypothetical protein